jgi:hypothetical protein
MPAGAQIAQRAGWRAAAPAPAGRCGHPRQARSGHLKRPPERCAAPAERPPLSVTSTGRARDARPGRSKPAAAAAAGRPEAPIERACGRADRTAPAGSAVAPRDRARAAWGWEYRRPAARVAGASLGEMPARVARTRHKGIRTKRLIFPDCGLGKQGIAGRWRRIGNGLRHAVCSRRHVVWEALYVHGSF